MRAQLGLRKDGVRGALTDESLQHVSGDHVGGHLELLGSISHALPPAGSVLPSEWHDAAVPDPFPDGLLRPPSLRS